MLLHSLAKVADTVRLFQFTGITKWVPGNCAKKTSDNGCCRPLKTATTVRAFRQSSLRSSNVALYRRRSYCTSSVRVNACEASEKAIVMRKGPSTRDAKCRNLAPTGIYSMNSYSRRATSTYTEEIFSGRRWIQTVGCVCMLNPLAPHILAMP